VQKTFTLSLTDCGSDTTKVVVTASGAEDNTDSRLFSNLESSGATGVAVAIWGDSTQSTQLTPDGLTSAEYTVSNQAVDMTFLARLMQTGDTAPTAGSEKYRNPHNGLRIKNPARYLAGLNDSPGLFMLKKISLLFYYLSGNS
jgi:hypothetical protein